MAEINWQFSGRKVTLDQIKSGDFPKPLTPFEKAALEFGCEWINGKSAFSISTSGSTGLPKHVSIHRSQMEASALLTEVALNLRNGSTALVCLDTQHIAGKMMLVRSLMTGMNIIGVEPSANPLLQLPENFSIDFIALVPYQLRAILNSPTSRQKLNEVRVALIGGAPLDEGLKYQLRTVRCQLYATYGMTETISHIALQKLNGTDPQNSFHVLPGISIGQDRRGCLTVNANYLGAEVIVTNDLVDILSAREFLWLGRFDHVINSGGIKIHPERIEREVENVFLELQLQNRFFIGSVEDPNLTNKLVLVVEGSPSLLLIQRIDEMLASRLDRHEKPREIKTVDRFAETASGKIDRKATIKSISDW